MSRELLVGVMLLLGFLLLPACERGQETPDNGAKAVDRLRVSTLPFLSFGPLFIAQEEGYFAQQGLEVEFEDLRRTQYGVPALITGQLDVLAAGMTAGILNSIARGADVRMVAGRSHVGYPNRDSTWFGVLARPEVLAEDSLRPGAGRLRVATPRDVIHGMVLDHVLSQAGLTEGDVYIRFIQYPALPEALASGATDLAIVGEPWVTRILDTGKAKLWRAGEDILPGGQVGSISFGPRLLREEPDLGRRFMVANLKGVRQYNRGKTERNLDILVRHSGLERELLKRLAWPALRNDGMLNVDNVMMFQRWAQKRGMLDRCLAPEEFWDSSFVQYAAAKSGKKDMVPGQVR